MRDIYESNDITEPSLTWKRVVIRLLRN